MYSIFGVIKIVLSSFCEQKQALFEEIVDFSTPPTTEKSKNTLKVKDTIKIE